MTTTTLHADNDATIPPSDQFDVWQIGEGRPHATDFRCDHVLERLRLHHDGTHMYSVVLRGKRLLKAREIDGVPTRRPHATFTSFLVITWPADTPFRQGQVQRWEEEYGHRLAPYIGGPEMLWAALRKRLTDADLFAASLAVPR